VGCLIWAGSVWQRSERSRDVPPCSGPLTLFRVFVDSPDAGGLARSLNSRIKGTVCVQFVTIRRMVRRGPSRGHDGS
jgi:hypothetical protein